MKVSRRQALGAGISAAIFAPGAVLAAPAPKTAAPTAETIAPALKLSCCAYSLRDYLPRGSKAGKISLSDWLEMAAGWGIDGVELTSYYFTSEEPKAMHELKAKAFKLGLDVSGAAVGNSFCVPGGEERAKQVALVNRWVDHAVELGAPCVRVFAGGKPKDDDRDRDRAGVVECLKQCCDHAGGRGVFLALENHGYLTETAPDMLAILDGVGHEWLGANLDTGNFVKEPYKNIEAVVPRTITTHVKTGVRTEDGSGHEPADLARIVGILRAANYRGYLSLEYEGEEDAWTAVPEYLKKMRQAMTAQGT